MSITVTQSDAAILETFNNMEERQEYVLNQFWFNESNRFRKENGWPVTKLDDFKFVRRGQDLFVNGSQVFWFKGKSNLSLAVVQALLTLGSTLSAAFTLALQNNGLEKFEKTVSCDGKVVEIDGRKYKLTSV